MQKNVAGQKIGAQLVSATDGSAFTGSVTVYVTGDAGTQAVGSVGSGACAHEGEGYHTYAPAQAETNYDLIAFTFKGTGAVPVTVQVYTRVDANVLTAAGTAWNSGAITEASFATTAGSFIPLGIIDQGTAQSATSTTVRLRAGATFAADDIKDSIILVKGSTQDRWQTGRICTDYDAGTKDATVDPAFTTPPTGTISYIVVAGAADLSTPPAVNVTQFGGASGTFSGGRPEVNTTHAAGTAWGSGAITAASIASDAITAAKIAANAIDADSLATDAVNEIRAAVTGGAYALSTDASGHVRVVDGTGAGEINTVGGAIANVVTVDSVANDVDVGNLATVAGAVWDELTSGHTTAGTYGRLLGVDGVTITGDAATMATRFLAMIELDGSVYRYTVNSLEQGPGGGGSGSFPGTADEWTALKAILGVPASGTTPADPTAGILDTIRDAVATVDDFLDTEVAAIKAKTDQLTFTETNQVDANTKSINDTAVNGTGVTGDKWRGA
jgi:hypothetical protein